MALITHVPTPTNVTVVPDSEHTPAAAASSVSVTGSPEVATTLTVYGGSPTSAFAGAVEVNMIVCAAFPTRISCRACGAALNVVFPGWSASITHMPGPMNDTVAPESMQTLVATGSIARATVSPEDAVALTVYVGPPAVAKAGGVDVKLIVWAAFPTVNDCCTRGAGANVASPAWSASITHVPAPMNDTVRPAIVHTLAPVASMVNVTGRPELAVALTSYDGPPMDAFVGAVEVNVIV